MQVVSEERGRVGFAFRRSKDEHTVHYVSTPFPPTTRQRRQWRVKKKKKKFEMMDSESIPYEGTRVVIAMGDDDQQ